MFEFFSMFSLLFGVWDENYIIYLRIYVNFISDICAHSSKIVFFFFEFHFIINTLIEKFIYRFYCRIITIVIIIISSNQII